MKLTEVTVVRIYCSEAGHQVQQLLDLLHDREGVAGVTAFRGIAGFGPSGRLHSATLLDLSLDMPLVIEFFDRPAKVAAVLEHLATLVAPGHLVTWSARVNLDND